MGDKWTPYTLGDLIDIKHGFAFQGDFFRDEPPGDILLTPGNFTIGGGFKGDKLKYYVGHIPNDFVLQEGDLLVTMTDLSKNADTLGYPAVVPKPARDRYLHNQRLGKVLIHDNAPLRKDFLYYLLCTREYRHEVLASATGTTVKHTSPDRIEAFKFRLPPLPEQKAIASILGALDDKIELNRKMNETLEAIARAIFKSWFVDFDPIPGFGPHKEWQNSPLGKIPKGWRVGTIEDLGHVICGKTPPTADSENYGTEMPFITIPDMHGQIFIIDTEKKLSRRGVSTQPSKTLPALSVCVSCIATPGLVVLTTEPSQTNQQINSVIHRDGISPYYCYMTLSELAHEIKARGSGGSVTLNLNKTQFATLPILLPDGSAINNFHKIVEPLFDKIFLKAKQFLTLAAIRDALLPKLLSGEIRVKV